MASLVPPERTLDAGAVLLVREGAAGRELFWVQRSREVSLGGGFYALPGGRTDPADRELAQALGLSSEDGALRVAALRELFEEAGVLLADGVPAARVLDEARRKLLDGASFAELMKALGVRLAPERLLPAGRWLTPPFIRTRFDTRFFLAAMPAAQRAEVWPGELARGEWITPTEALRRWEEGRALLHPPALHLARCLAEEGAPACLARMNAPSHMDGFVAERIEFQAGILLAPVRTPTLPPATHTNCYLVGEDELVVVDPASPYPEEQERLARMCRELLQEGRKFREILLTHHHHDHVGGVEALRQLLGVPVRAHRLAAELLAGEVRVDGFLEDGEIIALPGKLGLRLRVLHTPGHTRGHVVLLEERSGALIAGDLVAGVGTIVIDPPEGDMADYVASLQGLLDRRIGAIYPAHGPTLPDGPAKLREYLAHRADRERQVISALTAAGGTAQAIELVPAVYQDVRPELHPLAARSLSAVLDKLVREGRARRDDEERYTLVG